MRPRAAVGVRTCRAKPQTAVLGALTDVAVGLNCKDLMTLRVITRRRAVTHAKGRDAPVCLNLAGQSCHYSYENDTRPKIVVSSPPVAICELGSATRAPWSPGSLLNQCHPRAAVRVIRGRLEAT